MIAAWMAYALVIASLVSVAALIAERIAILRRLQSRWIWVAALLLSLALPMLFALAGARPSERPAGTGGARCRRKTSGVRNSRRSPGSAAIARLSRAASLGHVAARRMVGVSALALATLSMGWMQLTTTPAVCR